MKASSEADVTESGTHSDNSDSDSVSVISKSSTGKSKKKTKKNKKSSKKKSGIKSKSFDHVSFPKYGHMPVCVSVDWNY